MGIVRSTYPYKATMIRRLRSLTHNHHRPVSPNSDYLIIGAGSAGCVLTAHLLDSSSSVTLLEAGHSDLPQHHPFNVLLSLPSALTWPMSLSRYNWNFDASDGGGLTRRISCPRGRGVGGSSSINGMVFVRGHPADFDGWEEHWRQSEAADSESGGWSYRHVLPYFQRMEKWWGGQWEKGDAEAFYRGVDGPLHVKNGNNAAHTPLYQAFIQAGQEAGYGITRDYNGRRQEGFGPMAMTIFHHGPLLGRRCSTSMAYLYPALERQKHRQNCNNANSSGDCNGKLVTDAFVQRILFDKRLHGIDLPRAVGVEYKDSSGNIHYAYANKEVILCAGAIQSPQLLQVSGIGDLGHLRSIGVKTAVFHNPHVGNHLQDHLELYFQQEVKHPHASIAPIIRSYWQQLKVGVEWMLTRKGLGATNHFECGAFVRSAPHAKYPDIQFHFLPVGISYDGVTLAKSSTGHSMQIHIGICRPKSRGNVQATSPIMEDPPEIQFNYMSQKEDWRDMKRGIEIARQIMRQPCMKDIAGEEILPGKDADLDEYIQNHVESAYHPCGTCRMGRSSDHGVVDKCGKVYGVDGLRVVDASIFPSITNGNLNAPVIMVAEKIADDILGKEPLPMAIFDEGCEPWKPPTLERDREGEPMRL